MGCQRIHIPITLKGAAGTIEFDIKSCRDAVKRGGILLTLGYNTGFLAAYTRSKKITNVINMDGIEWRRDKYGRTAKLYLWLNERIAAIAGDVLIADHPQIAMHHANHARSDKIHMIPYGSENVTSSDESILDHFSLQPRRYLTVIARPEPENSLLEIVRAFSRKERGIKLVVLGKYDREQEYQLEVLSSASREVIFPGAIYDKKTVQALRFFSLAYMHGHQVGGTNPSLVEALGAGNAVIAHSNDFNRWVAGDAAIYFSSEDECDECIDRLTSSEKIQTHLRKCANERWIKQFTWPSILTQYEELLSNSYVNATNA